jgi:hypothetical protein
VGLETEWTLVLERRGLYRGAVSSGEARGQPEEPRRFRFADKEGELAEKKTATRRTSAAKAKKEMVEAYGEQLSSAEERREAELKPEERIAEKAAKKAVGVADSVSVDGILREVGDLKLDLGKVLANLADRLEQEVARYEAVKEAISVKEKELQEIYEIQRSAGSLTALLEAQHDKREEFDAEMATRREALNREIEEARAEWKKEKVAHEAEAREREAEEQKRRQREQEEFQYALAREQQVARDRFADEKAAYEEEKARVEREIQARREQLEKELSEREKAVRESEEELKELRARAASFPRELDTAVAKEVKASVERAKSEASGREELLKKEFEGERNVLKTRIGALESAVKEQVDQIGKLQQQLERSYSQIQDIAVKAIQGASGSRGAPSAPQPAAETPKLAL